MHGTKNSRRPFRFVLDEAMNLLVIDGDPVRREFSQVCLASPVADNHSVESAEAALSLLKDRSFDMALVDVDLEGMDGITLMRQLRGDPLYDHMAIIVITGREDMASIDAAFDAGATSCAVKPVNWRLLSHQIRFLMRAHRAITVQYDSSGVGAGGGAAGSSTQSEDTTDSRLSNSGNF